MDTKASFEKWWVDSGTHLLHSENGQTKAKYFDIWKESRSAIEIELPEHCKGRSPDAEGYDDALDECIEAITSHGIRIKGKTE